MKGRIKIGIWKETESGGEEHEKENRKSEEIIPNIQAVKNYILERYYLFQSKYLTIL